MYEELVMRLRLAKAVLSRNKDLIALLSDAADAIEKQQKLNCELLFRVGQAEALIDYYQTGRMTSNALPKEKLE